MHEQSNDFNEETENIKMHQTQITELKDTIIKVKNSIQGSKAEERIGKLGDRTVKCIQSEKKKKE